MGKYVRMAIIAAGAGGLAAGLTLARGAGDSNTQPITGCRDKATGNLRVIETSGGQTCSAEEEELVWNREGPQGPEGPSGGGDRATEQQLWLFGAGGGLLFSPDCPDYAFVGHLPGNCGSQPDAGATQTAVPIDAGRYPSASKAKLEASMNVEPNGSFCVRLYDLTDAAPVMASETCGTGSAESPSAAHLRQLSDPFDLAKGNHEYAMQMRSTRLGPCGATVSTTLPTPPATVAPTAATGDPEGFPPSPSAGSSSPSPPALPGTGVECGSSALLRVRLIIDW